ncbi:MAG: IS3 family transposase [Veillonella sp.]|nr:IS3 family transposase [Veillonella sp.]
MSKYSKEVKEKAIYLSEKGWGRFRIAKELEVPESTIKNWLHKFNLNHNLTHKIGTQVFSADFKRKVLEARWKNKLSFKETAELFNLDNPSLIATWQKRYLEEGILGLQPKPKGRPPMKTKKEIKIQVDSSQKSDKERIKELEAENARLKYEISFYDDFMKEMREIYFGISRSTYYARLASINKGDKYIEERDAIRTLVSMNKGRYGYRRITIALHKLGFNINHKVVMRIMKEENLTCKVRLKKYRLYRGTEGKIAPNIIKRNFTATKPDQKWTTDITEFHLFG